MRAIADYPRGRGAFSAPDASMRRYFTPVGPGCERLHAAGESSRWGPAAGAVVAFLPRAVRRRRRFLGVREPDPQCGAGASGTLNCCYEHGRQIPFWEAPPDGPHWATPTGRRSHVDVLVERCSGLDVHKDSVMATVRTPGPAGQREEVTKEFGTTT